MPDHSLLVWWRSLCICDRYTSIFTEWW